MEFIVHVDSITECQLHIEYTRNGSTVDVLETINIVCVHILSTAVFSWILGMARELLSTSTYIGLTHESTV